MSEKASFSDDDEVKSAEVGADPVQSALSRIDKIDEDSNFGAENFDAFSQSQKKDSESSDSDESGSEDESDKSDNEGKVGIGVQWLVQIRVSSLEHFFAVIL